MGGDKLVMVIVIRMHHTCVLCLYTTHIYVFIYKYTWNCQKTNLRKDKSSQEKFLLNWGQRMNEKYMLHK